MKKIFTSLIILVGLIFSVMFSAFAETNAKENISTISAQAKQTVIKTSVSFDGEIAKAQTPPDKVANLKASLRFAVAERLNIDYTENLRKLSGNYKNINYLSECSRKVFYKNRRNNFSRDRPN